MGWRTAKSLIGLRTQLNNTYPKRSTASDGTIGNAAHRATASDHNPNAYDVVCALDITHDPANGLDAHALAEVLIANRHPNLKYVISNRRIAGAWTNWKWQRYDGSNPHNKHIHVSVGVGDNGKSKPGTYDNTAAWVIRRTAAPAPSTGGKYSGMPRVGQRVQFNAGISRTVYQTNGSTRQFKPDGSYLVRGIDNNKIVINSVSGGGNGVKVALFALSGAKFNDWRIV